MHDCHRITIRSRIKGNWCPVDTNRHLSKHMTRTAVKTKRAKLAYFTKIWSSAYDKALSHCTIKYMHSNCSKTYQGIFIFQVMLSDNLLCTSQLFLNFSLWCSTRHNLLAIGLAVKWEKVSKRSWTKEHNSEAISIQKCYGLYCIQKCYGRSVNSEQQVENIQNTWFQHLILIHFGDKNRSDQCVWSSFF